MMQPLNTDMPPGNRLLTFPNDGAIALTTATQKAALRYHNIPPHIRHMMLLSSSQPARSKRIFKKLNNNGITMQRRSFAAKILRGAVATQKATANERVALQPHTMSSSSSRLSNSKRIFKKSNDQNVFKKRFLIPETAKNSMIIKKETTLARTQPHTLHTINDSDSINDSKVVGIEQACEQIQLFLFPQYPDAGPEVDALLGGIMQAWDKFTTNKQKTILEQRFSTFVGSFNTLRQAEDPLTPFLSGLKNLADNARISLLTDATM